MIKTILVVLILSLFYSLINISTVLANHIGAGDICIPTDPTNHCIRGYSCQPSKPDPKTYFCQLDPFGGVFGKIEPPDALKKFIGSDPTGAGGISKLLSNIITLFYSVAAIVLIFMFIWGAFDWMTSGGEKEKLESARNKIISAIIGIMLFAVAFAVIQVLGQFTGFKFFSGQTTPQSPTNSQPSNSCAITYSTCLHPGGGTEGVAPKEQQKCEETYRECLRTTHL